MKSTRRWQQLLLNSLAIILGNALYSLAVALFLEPAGLITGGATGIALAFGRLTGLSVSGFLFLFNMSMLVWGWAVLGKKFALNTLASSVLSPAFLGLFERTCSAGRQGSSGAAGLCARPGAGQHAGLSVGGEPFGPAAGCGGQLPAEPRPGQQERPVQPGYRPDGSV